MGGDIHEPEMQLLIETTQSNQKVAISAFLGFITGEPSNNPDVIGGTLDWGDGNKMTFNNGDAIDDEKFTHVYVQAKEHTITISGKIAWHPVKMNTNYDGAQENVAKILKKIKIPTGKVSPIYDTGPFAFSSCGNLTEIPANLFENCTKTISFQESFASCTSLIAIPAGLFKNCTGATNFSYCFYGCSELAAIPESLFENCTRAKNFDHCFFNCSSISGPVPQLWVKFPTAESSRCFYKCTKASNYSQIPEEWK